MEEYKVEMVSLGGVRHTLMTGRYDECAQFCEDHNWTFFDENEFQWDLEIENN